MYSQDDSRFPGPRIVPCDDHLRSDLEFFRNRYDIKQELWWNGCLCRLDWSEVSG